MQEIIKLLETNKKGVEEPAIRETEQKLTIRFPDHYVQLFKLANGPEVGEWTLFPIKDPKNIKKTWDDVVRQNQEVLNYQLEGKSPPNTLLRGILISALKCTNTKNP